MKKHLSLSAIMLALGVFLFAQEKVEVSMKVIKDGKVVKDTTYAFDDSKDAKHAVHMFDAMASGDHHMEFIHKDEDAMKLHKKVIFISEDGKKVEKSEGNHTWVSKKDGEEDVIIMKMDKHSDGHVYVSSDDEDGIVKVIVKEIGEGDCEQENKKVMKKKIMVIADEDDEDGTWTIKEGEDGEEVMYKKIEGEDGEVIIIKKIKSEGEEEIEVEVITKDMKEKKMKMEKKENINEKTKKKSKK